MKKGEAFTTKQKLFDPRYSKLEMVDVCNSYSNGLIDGEYIYSLWCREIDNRLDGTGFWFSPEDSGVIGPVDGEIDEEEFAEIFDEAFEAIELDEKDFAIGNADDELEQAKTAVEDVVCWASEDVNDDTDLVALIDEYADDDDDMEDEKKELREAFIKLVNASAHSTYIECTEKSADDLSEYLNNGTNKWAAGCDGSEWKTINEAISAGEEMANKKLKEEGK